MNDIFIMLLVASSSLLSAQSVTYEVTLKEYDKWKKQGNIHNGKHFVYLDSSKDKLVLEFTYKNARLNGIYKSWYTNGQLEEIKYFTNDTLNGNYQSWYQNGQSKITTSYQMGNLHGLYESWYIDGKVKRKGDFKNAIKIGEHYHYGNNHGDMEANSFLGYRDSIVSKTIYHNGFKQEIALINALDDVIFRVNYQQENSSYFIEEYIIDYYSNGQMKSRKKWVTTKAIIYDEDTYEQWIETIDDKLIDIEYWNEKGEKN